MQLVVIELIRPWSQIPQVHSKRRKLRIKTAYFSRIPLRVPQDCHIQRIFVYEKLTGSVVQVLLNIHGFWNHGSCYCVIKGRFRTESEVFFLQESFITDSAV
jgi:hypothetical protein